MGSDLAQQIAALFCRYDPERWAGREVRPTDEDWRRLAILMAFSHGDLNYRSSHGAPRRAEESEIVIDDLMEKCIFARRHIELNDGRRETWLSHTAEKQMSDVKAAQKVVKILRQMAAAGRYSGKIPTAGTIRSRYSARRSERVRRGEGSAVAIPLPHYLRKFVEWRGVLATTERVAGQLTHHRLDILEPEEGKNPY